MLANTRQSEVTGDILENYIVAGEPRHICRLLESMGCVILVGTSG